jgi:hypothetical protein
VNSAVLRHGLRILAAPAFVLRKMQWLRSRLRVPDTTGPACSSSGGPVT